MITCQPESFGRVLPELAPLLPVHYEMLALNKAEVPLRPNYAEYLRRETQGECSTIVLRENGRVIGYWIQFVAPGLHYQTCLTATMDIFFIQPEFRSGSAALRLMHGVETENRRRGVLRWFAGEKLHAPVGRLFAACGFEPVERTWAKWLGTPAAFDGRAKS